MYLDNTLEAISTKAACPKSKFRSIVVNVLAPLSINKIGEEPQFAKFLSVTIDPSDHKYTKLVPILVRYIVPHPAGKEEHCAWNVLQLHSSKF
jgi:hypothetical protein